MITALVLVSTVTFLAAVERELLAVSQFRKHLAWYAPGLYGRISLLLVWLAHR